MKNKITTSPIISVPTKGVHEKKLYGRKIHVGGIELRKKLLLPKSNGLSYYLLEDIRPHVQAIIDAIRINPELTQDPLVKELARTLSVPFAKAANPLAAKVKWSDEMKKTKAQGRCNPAQFIRKEYAQELRTEVLTRANLRTIDYPLSQAFDKWVSRHPADGSIFPGSRQMDGDEVGKLAKRREANALAMRKLREKRKSVFDH